MRKVTVLEGPALGSYLSQMVNYEATQAFIPSICISEALGSSYWQTGLRVRDLKDPGRWVRGPTINWRHVRTVELYSIGAVTADTARLSISCRSRPVGSSGSMRWRSTAGQVAAPDAAGVRAASAEHPTPDDPALHAPEEPDTNPAAGVQVLEVDQLKADVELGDKGFARSR